MSRPFSNTSPESQAAAPLARPAGEELWIFKRKILLVVTAAGLVLLSWAVRDILILIFIAGVLAAGISPVIRRVRALTRFYLHRRMSRGTAVATVYLPFVLGALALLTFVLPKLLIETRQLSSQLPGLIEGKLLHPLERYVSVERVREYMNQPRERMAVVPYIKGAAVFFSSIVAVLFLMFYMLVDAERLMSGFLLLFPEEQRTRRRRTIQRITRRMSSWLSGQLILAGIIGATTFVGLLVLRIPYALALALLATVGELVPVIGPILGSIPTLTVALFQSSWQFWSVLALAVLLQKFENLFLVPRLMGRRVQVSPLWVFISFMIGGTLLGIIGAVMAIPAAAILQVTLEEAFVAPRERRLQRGRPGALLRQHEP